MRWWPRVTGCAAWRWVKPGITLSACSSARATSTRWKAVSALSASSIAPRTHRRKSVATWSFLDRAVWRRPAAGPISSASRASTCMWMSSSAGSSRTPRSAYSSSIRSSPSAMAEASSSGTMPWASSMVTWARLAWMSSRHRRLSKAIEALISRISADGPPANRPPHIRFDLALSSAMTLSPSLILALLKGRALTRAGRPTTPYAMGGDFDVLIVGAGLSGIGTACHLAMKCPGKSYAILEARDSIGGTWDLFRYPGIRSDSDMYTLGYAFRPWRDAKAIADGSAIKAYVEDTAREYGVTPHIRFRHKVVRASWSSDEARWTVEAETPEGPARFTARILMMCSGYYSYDEGYRPDFPGEADFRGRFVHPQFWPADLDYTGK